MMYQGVNVGGLEVYEEVTKIPPDHRPEIRIYRASSKIQSPPLTKTIRAILLPTI